MTTTRAPGLTAAMRRALEDTIHASPATLERLHMAGLWDDGITPRGQAALAAPRMTNLQLVLLAAIEKEDSCAITYGKTLDRVVNAGWVTRHGALKLTPSGLTALNNMRAAMGSAEYKETV